MKKIYFISLYYNGKKKGYCIFSYYVCQEKYFCVYKFKPKLLNVFFITYILKKLTLKIEQIANVMKFMIELL